MAEIGDRFADALYIHPFNVPKSRILTMRAANAAARAGKQLLWVVAKDVTSRARATTRCGPWRG
eukprot:9490804-Pyramimonas_sp.AAC.1